MKKEIDIWNILHDGEITAAEKGADGSYILFINIPYLRRRLPPLGDSFVLTLSGVKQIIFQVLDNVREIYRLHGVRQIMGQDLDNPTLSLEAELELTTPTILQTESESMPISVTTTTGTLILDYENISFNLDTGQPVEFETIERICREYWDEFNKRSQTE